ncbi:F-box protein SKIP22-like [Juglans microcarpa x Juglans regia]|uniref:F-box protein SKIP22-like n=1 Tax=Juglans microcarpa x Juglans regia TaxID=2249226 RepID=UPI001B7E69A9|nr:F-box protein SKIP22-like [Juglans microcarpa x Juglans regia]
MKLRLRSVESKQTLRIEVPAPFTLQQLQETLSQSISSSSSLHISLNRKDELQASSPEASLHSLGITSGDLLYFTFDPAGFSSSPIQTQARDSVQKSQALAPRFSNRDTGSQITREPKTLGEMSSNPETPIPESSVQGLPEWPDVADSDMSDSTILQEQGGSLVSDSDYEETLEVTSAETVEVADGSVSSSGKKFYERCFLRRILGEELGDYGGDHKLLVIAVHAVLLESGFVGFDSISGIRIDRFHLADEWPSNAFTMSLCYTLPELLGNDDGYAAKVPESVVLKFQSLGHFINIYGSLAGGRSGLYRVCLNENRFAPAIGLANGDSNRANDEDGYPESEVFEFWKIVKDGLALPLLIDLCERAGLVPPPCFMRLHAELKLKILESLPGVDLAKMGCVCSELRYLSSNNELWKRKFEEAFGRGGGGIEARGLIQWKDRFGTIWESNKKRKREAWPRRGVLLPVRRDPSPFGFPPPMVGGDYDRLPGLGVPLPFGQHVVVFPRLQLRRNFTPRCSLGLGGSDSGDF